MTIQVGDLFYVSTGSYSDYGIHGHYRLLKMIAPATFITYHNEVEEHIRNGRTVVTAYETQIPRFNTAPAGVTWFAHTQPARDALAKEKERFVTREDLKNAAKDFDTFIGWLTKNEYIEDVTIPEIYAGDSVDGIDEFHKRWMANT